MLRKSLPGPYSATALGPGKWELTTNKEQDTGTDADMDSGTGNRKGKGPGKGTGGRIVTGTGAGTRILLLGTAADAGGVLSTGGILAITVEWGSYGVNITVSSTAGVRQLTADSVIIHQPRPGLYAALPLAGFDAAARRFWRRVFLLMRLPGGRFLLRFITQGKRRAGAPSRPV